MFLNLKSLIFLLVKMVGGGEEVLRQNRKTENLPFPFSYLKPFLTP